MVGAGTEDQAETDATAVVCKLHAYLCDIQVEEERVDTQATFMVEVVALVLSSSA